MSRRDTIIIAVLINVGLLTILFATARNMDGQQELTTRPTPQPVMQEQPLAAALQPPTPEPVSQVTELDEVDRAIANFETQTPQTPTGVATTTPMPSTMVTPNSLATPTPVDIARTLPPPTPVVTDVAPVEELPQYAEVTVKKGDTLDRIARSNSSSVEALVALNGLKTTRLTIGQKLRVPTAARSTAARSTTTAPVATQAGRDPKFYVVEAGDNPWLIARRHNMPLEELLKLNRLDDSKARNLKVGDRIRIQ